MLTKLFQNFYKKNSTLIILLLLLFAATKIAFGQTTDLPNMETGVVLEPALEIRLGEGTNLFGKRTLFAGSGLHFGSISFTHPERISNGDAYLQNGHLYLEAVINVALTFNGVDSVSLDIKKLPVSSNPFYKTSFSTSLQRSVTPEPVFEDPRNTQVNTFTKSTEFPLRMVLELSPQQKGYIYDRFRLEARGL